MVQFLSIIFFFLYFFNFCWVFQKFPFFCVTLYNMTQHFSHTVFRWAEIATSWMVRGSNPGGARFSAVVQTDPGPPSLLYSWHQVISGVNGWGMALTAHHHLARG